MNTGITLPLLIALIVALNLLSRVYGFWVIRKRESTPKRGLLFWGFIFLLALLPIGLPPEHPIIKWLLLNYTCLHIFKSIDYYHRYESLPQENREFKRFFFSFDCLYTTNINKCFVKEEPPVPGKILLKNFAAGVLYGILGMAVLIPNLHFGWWRLSPLLDYTTLAAECLFLTMGAASLFLNIHRLMGYRVFSGFLVKPILSSSPQELWARWNLIVHEWMEDNVFKKVAGHHRPYRGLFLTFVASGLFHEYTISLASNTLNGFMLAYFLIQFVVLILSMSLHRLLLKHLPGYNTLRTNTSFVVIKWSLTMASATLPGVLFIHNLRKIFPLHPPYAD